MININNSAYSEENKIELIKNNWSFDGIFGTYDRASLQRGYQVYQEVCSGCHSVQHLSYRNLSEEGGPEFTLEEAKAIAAQFEITDGPNEDGEMFTRPGRLSDKFVSPFPNVKAAAAANDGLTPRYVGSCKSKKRWSRLYLLFIDGIRGTTSWI